MTSRDQGLQNWTGGTLNIIKLIGMNSRFASICIKAQEQKWPIFFCQIVQFFSHFLFLCLYANRCEPRVHSYQFYYGQSISSPILKSLVPWGHLVGGYLSLCYYTCSNIDIREMTKLWITDSGKPRFILLCLHRWNSTKVQH